MCPFELQIQIFISESCVLLCLNIFSGSFGSDLFHSQWICVKIKWVNVSKSLGRVLELTSESDMTERRSGRIQEYKCHASISISISLIIFQSSYFLLFEWVPLARPLSLIVLSAVLFLFFITNVAFLSTFILFPHFFLDSYEHTFHLFIWVHNL